jgi:tRNA/rRNA methyltransferase
MRHLVVVAPRFPGVLSHPDAIAYASGAIDLLQQSREVESLDEALADTSLAVAISAEGREFGPSPQPPEVMVEVLQGELTRDPTHRVALVFGTERTGLSIAEVSRCQALLAIPTAPGYGSLNLAQAVQVVAFSLAQAARRAGAPIQSPQEAVRYATQEQVAALFEHLEQALIDIAFVDPRHPKKLMPRLRRLLGRTRLEIEEVDLLRGICTQMQKQAGRP